MRKCSQVQSSDRRQLKTPGCTLLVRRANQDQAAALDQVTRWELGRRVAETIRGLNARCADTGATTAFWLSASDSLRIERHSLAASAVPRCSPTRSNSHKAQSRKGETSDRRPTAQPPKKSRSDERHPYRHRFMDRQKLDRLWAFLSSEVQQPRRKAALLRVAVSACRGGQQLLRDAEARGCTALGGTHAAGLYVQHKGVPAVHWPPDLDGSSTERRRRSTRTG